MSELISLIEANTAMGQNRGGVRDIMNAVPALQSVASHPRVISFVHQVLGPEAIVVRSTLFDKTSTANWKVPWHQDLTIAVRERRDT